ncbi:NAD-dependent epimerase/dehydratase family protein [Rhodoplanes sp. TEM]|uniref:NAD-dependent epimerase/dehydratase family protein n=1 Tax=Rhodoplanes tepidamans TaxID=200616 RepID=A0ABT5JDE6_RHOTP|nr:MULTISPECIES: hopanoid-associated sugar epimerase [Rhodoplanes]MDC7787708.1 NAD-dependent epimerase/dehydratase family protein [Rhodoplanes tepidamans]MDC7986604.1 NAD-dependent epimerase/dehydratase family protein [Rhodoplanes sp. TEM]
MPSDIVLVTGASGFLGAAVANVLRRDGFRVRVLVRPTSPRENLDPSDEVVTGDLTDRASLARAMHGVRHLFHVAADYRLWASDPSVLFRVNVDGTRLVMEEALRAGVERVVYTSSVATLRLAEGVVADETMPLDADHAIGAYKKSKVLGERVVEEMVARERLPAVIVNPSTPIGPRDVKPTPTGRIIVEAAGGRMPAFVDTGLNLAHVDDVAAGHLLALRRGEVGERYILGGENVFLRDMLIEIARRVGRRPPRLELPRRALFPLAWAAEGVAKLTGREPFVTADGLRLAKYRMFFDDKKARREIGYVSRPWQDGIADALAWFRQAGMVG